jgi:hypothetical protein
MNHMMISEWVEENQIDKEHDYAKGWNDLMDFVFRLQCEFDKYELGLLDHMKCSHRPRLR